MALREKKAKAVLMRIAGASYSQLKEELKVSKSTLSLWLRDYPLSEARIRELRDTNPIRIERYRETRRLAREIRDAAARKQAIKEIGRFSKRDLLIGGFFLYWGEGTKTSEATVCVSNTDPTMLRYFIKWLSLLGVPKEKLIVRLHLYADMNIQKESAYWSKTLSLPPSHFRKPYVKHSHQTGLSYPQRFKHGTCNVMIHNKKIFDKTLFTIEHIRSKFARGIDA